MKCDYDAMIIIHYRSQSFCYQREWLWNI